MHTCNKLSKSDTIVCYAAIKYSKNIINSIKSVFKLILHIKLY